MSPDTIKQRLIAARALIAKPEHWTQGTLGRNAEGKAAWLHENAVVARCATGAIMDACPVNWLDAEVRDIRRSLIHSINHHATSDPFWWSQAVDATPGAKGEREA